MLIFLKKKIKKNDKIKKYGITNFKKIKKRLRITETVQFF